MRLAAEPHQSVVKKVARYVTNPSRAIDRASRLWRIQTSDICWIFGVGRSGSSWLTELLDGLHSTRTWHEPYFGTLLSHPTGLPSEFDRTEYIFARQYEEVWKASLRNLLLDSVRARYGKISRGTKIIVKDINAPQLCPHFASIFPDSQYLLLVRDPYDVLDSHLDMAKPGSWNSNPPALADAAATADHIRRVLETSLAGYRSVREDKRLLVRYRDLIADPVAELTRCSEFLGLPVTQKEIHETVEAHRFQNYTQTGQLAFRRFGKVGIWKESGNFTPQVLCEAEEILGDLRCLLGYESAASFR